MDLHISASNTSNQTLHTIRNHNGSWQKFYGNILTSIPNGSPMRTRDLDVAQQKIPIVANVLHEVLLIESDPLLPQFNQVCYTKRKSNGSWTALVNLNPFLNATPNLAPNSSYQRVSCALANADQDILLVLVLTNNGQLIKIEHNCGSSVADDNWSNGSLIETTPEHGRITDITCFIGAQKVEHGLSKHQFFIGTITTLGRAISYNFPNSYYAGSFTIVFPSQTTWLTNGSIAGLSRISGAFDPNKNQEHFVVCVANGQLWHTCAGQASFGNVTQASGNPANMSYTDVSCSFTPAGLLAYELQIVALHTNGAPFHTIRKKDGSLQGLVGNINTQCGQSGVLICVGIG